MTIGVVTQNIGSPFYDLVTQGVTSRLTKTDYSPIFVDGQWKPEIETAVIETLINRRVDGLIIVGGTLSSKQLKAACGDTPTVLVAQSMEGWEEHSICIDNVKAACLATNYLIEAGHQDIAHLAGIHDHRDAVDRLEGYKKALNEANLDYNPDLVIGGNFSSQSGVLAIESLLLRGVAFSAIFAANDEMAFGARLGLYRRGIRVPEDISIVGFDNQPVSAYVTPPLTTVAQPANEMGAAAADVLLNLLRKEPIEIPQFEVKLVVRESVARRR